MAAKISLVISLLIPSFVFSQLKPKSLSNDTFILKNQTLYIMKKLGIGVRKNINKDDALFFGTYNSRFISCVYGQDAIAPYYRSKGLDTNERWYIKPIINLSTTLNSIIRNKKDTTHLFYIDAFSSVIHELTHYYQNTYTGFDSTYIKGTLENFQEHVEQPVELEAYEAEAYYFLFFADKKALKKIMELKIPKKERFKILYNSQH